MNPYETSTQSQPPQQQKPKSQLLGTLKKALAFAIIIVFFTGCFKIQKGIPITTTTTFADMSKVSLFHAIFVLPMAKLMIGAYKLTNSALIAIAFVTFVNRFLGSFLTIKSTVEAERMKELQPKMNAINAKYVGLIVRNEPKNLLTNVTNAIAIKAELVNL